MFGNSNGQIKLRAKQNTGFFLLQVKLGLEMKTKKRVNNSSQ